MSQNDLEQLHKSYPSKAGFAFLSQGALYGEFNLHKELSHLSWFELNLYGITGRFFDPTEIKILNYIWLSTSYADLRIWPNRIVALASSARSTPILSLAAGISSCDAALFVAQPLVNCLSMYLNFTTEIQQGCSLKELLDAKLNKQETIFGFGRPITSVDERVPHFVQFLNQQNKDDGYCFKMAFQIENYLKQQKNIQMNIAALYAAVCADLGFNAMQMNLFVSLLVFSGMPPCYIEANQKPAGSVLPLKCEDINYQGEALRKW